MPFRKLTTEAINESKNCNEDETLHSPSPKKIKLETEGTAMFQCGFGHSTALFPARSCTNDELAQPTRESILVKEEVAEDTSSKETIREDALTPEAQKHETDSTSALKVEAPGTIPAALVSNGIQLPPVPVVLEQSVLSLCSNSKGDACLKYHDLMNEANEKTMSASKPIELVPFFSEKVADHEVEVVNEITKRQYEVVDLTDDISPASTLPPSPDAENTAAQNPSHTVQFSTPLLDFLDHNVVFDQELISQLQERLNVMRLVFRMSEISEDKRDETICPIVVDDDDDVMILDTICPKTETTPPKRNVSSPKIQPKESITDSTTDYSILPMDISPEGSNKDEVSVQFNLEHIRNALSFVNKTTVTEPVAPPSPIKKNSSNLQLIQNVTNLQQHTESTKQASSNPAIEKQKEDCNIARQNSLNLELVQDNPFRLPSSTQAKRPRSPEDGFQDEEASVSRKKFLDIQEYRSRIDPRKKAFPSINTPSPPIANQVSNFPPVILNTNNHVFPAIGTLASPPCPIQDFSHEERTAQFFAQTESLTQTWNPNFPSFSLAQPTMLNSFPRPLQHQTAQSMFSQPQSPFPGHQYPYCTPYVQVPPVNVPLPFNFANAPSLSLSRNLAADNAQPPQIFHQTPLGKFHASIDQSRPAIFPTPPSNEVVLGQKATSYRQNQMAKSVKQNIVRPLSRMPTPLSVPRQPLPKSVSTIPEWFKRYVGHNEMRSEHLHLIALDWDITSMHSLYQNKELPNLATEFNQVRNSYSDLLDYYNTYFPLMLVEYWNKLFRSYSLFLDSNRQLFFRLTTFEVKRTLVNEEIETYLMHCDAVVRTSDVNFNLFPKEKQIVLVSCLSGRFLAYVRESGRRKFSPAHDSQHLTLERNCVSLEDSVSKLSKVRLKLELACKPPLINSGDIFNCSKLSNFRPLLKQNDALLKLKTSPFRDVLLDPLAERCVEIISLPLLTNADKMTSDEMTNAMDNIYLRVRDCDHHITLVTCPPEQQQDFLHIIVSRLRRELTRRLLVCCKEESLTPFFISLQTLGLELVVLDRELRRNCSPMLKNRTFDELVGKNKCKKQDILEECEVLLAPAANCFFEDMREASFDTCIFFDADQFTEPESVICLSYNVRHLVMVGTPGRTCPTSDMTAKWDYGKSLFQRAYDTS